MRESLNIQQVKSWIFPGLISIVSFMIWNTMTEVRSDVKALLAQSNIDKTRIDNLERVVYSKASEDYPYTPPAKIPEVLTRVAVIPRDELIAKVEPKTK